jgi:hypothetical protein
MRGAARRGPREGLNRGMGCGASATVKTESPALEGRVSLPEFKHWYLKLLVKDASKAARVGPSTRTLNPKP